MNNKYKTLFSPTDFDLIISDESHRLLGGGNSRALFEYFLGYKLGLTATPKDYLKHLDTDNIEDPREMERRKLETELEKSRLELEEMKKSKKKKK